MESTNNYTETDLGNVSPNPKGTYDNATAYEYLDLVEYQGGSYLCIVNLDKTVKGINPTVGQNSETWQLVALPGTSTEEYVAKHTEVIEKAKQVETSRAAVELCKQEVESAQADVEQMRQDTQQVAQNASDANTEAQQAAQQSEASRSAAQTSEQNAAASRDLANTYKENAETAAQEATESKTAAETAAQNAAKSKEDIDNIKSDIEEAAKGENVSQIQQNMNEISQLKESLEECIDVTSSRNILAFENYTRGKYYSSSSGSDRYNDSFTAIDDYVKIEPNTDYVFSVFSDGNYKTIPNAVVIQYDIDRKYISGADVKTFKTAINARYIRLSMANVYFDKQVMLEKGTEPSKIYESPLIEKKYKIKNECIDDTQICDKVISILKIKENEITVGASDCNFETLQEAISSIKDNTELNRYIICLKEGTYNLADGLDITDSSVMGVTVPNWATIVGIGNRENVILECRLDSRNQNISALNFKETSGIENLSIIGENTRYAIHDDFARESKGYDRRIKHCIIRGENTYYSTVYGAGTGDGANLKFEDVVFDGTKTGTNYKKGNTFTVHNILKSQKNREITFANCRFLSGLDNNVKLKTLAYRTATGLDSANDMLTNVQFFGCEFSGETGFELSEENASVYGSGCLYYVTGFGNKNANHNIVTTDGKDYSGRVNLI